MDQSIWQNILYGFQVNLLPANLLYCFIGVLIGTLVGVLPGLGSAAAMALLLPSTFSLKPSSAIIMLAGLYYGAMYGGSTTSILVNIPGEASSVPTCLDGYQMARKGRAGAALGISAFGSFIGGTISTILLMLVAPPLANIALKFGPPEYFSLIILGFVLLIYLAAGSMVKAFMMAIFGVILGCVGMDVITGTARFVYGVPALSDGVGLVPVLVAREILLRGAYVSGSRMAGFLSGCVTLAISAFYELIEWWVALAIGQDADAFLGTQGDPWDTQSDMFFALIGALAGLALLSKMQDSQMRQLSSDH